MKKQECEYIRKDRSIRTLSTNEVQHFESINKAKKASWKLQGAGTELGLGKVALDKKS